MKFHGVYKLNEDPCIMALWGDDALEKVHQMYRGGKLYFLWHNAWFTGRVKSMLKIKYNFFRLSNKGITPIQLTNSPLEDNYRKKFGIKGFMCMPYIYTNEVGYEAKDDADSPIYDAIYIAQLAPFKRLELTSNIDALFVLTYKQGGAKSWNLHEEYPALQHAEFNSKWVGTEQKRQKLYQSSVGLCLSQEEGPMLASLEYMLSGLPVVSTESRGGRDGYYDDEYCLIVKDNPKAVAEGVKEMISRNLSREMIREQTIQKLNYHRQRYVNFICDFVKKDSGKTIDPDNLFHYLFKTPEKNFMPLDKLASI